MKLWVLSVELCHLEIFNNNYFFPYRWRSLTPVGQPIPGTRFIAFKVPLKGVCIESNYRLYHILQNQ